MECLNNCGMKSLDMNQSLGEGRGAMIQSKNTSHPKCPGGMGVRSHCISVQALADLQDQDLVVVIDDDDDDDDGT